MQNYLELLSRIMTRGDVVQTGASLVEAGRRPTARRLHAEQIHFDMDDGFPAVTTKPLWWRAVVAEWIWFMRGSGDGQYLVDEKVDSIWAAWFKDEEVPHAHGDSCYKVPDRLVAASHASGSQAAIYRELACNKVVDTVRGTDLGPVYGRQFRRFQGVKYRKRSNEPDARDVATIRRHGQRLYHDSTGLVDEWALNGWRYAITPAEGDDDTARFRCLGPHHEVVEVDQIGQARDDIRAVVADRFNRARRRIIVTLWNPPQIADMALPPCHTFHFYDMVPPRDPAALGSGRPFGMITSKELDDLGKWTLNLHLCARSIDAVKGLPFNIASYALMLHVMSRITGCKPGRLTITFNDVHIYDNQEEDVREQLERIPFAPPRLDFPAHKRHIIEARTTPVPTERTVHKLPGFDAVCKDLSIEEAHRLDPWMFQLSDYKYHPKLRSESEVAV